jgi:CheY-like chemotaxis protein
MSDEKLRSAAVESDGKSNPATPGPNAGILVVDDFTDGREVLIEYLGYSGFSVHGAADGTQAIEMALRLRPKVILMDLAMPGVDGVETTRRLKADDRTKDIVIVALTARAAGSDQNAARLAGCEEFVSKPCDLPSLVDLLSRLTRPVPPAA